MKNLLKYAFLLIFSVNAFAQQASEIDPKFVKLPRYANEAAINSTITSPTQGMIVYNIATASNWYYNGANWINMDSAASGTFVNNDASSITPVLQVSTNGVGGSAGIFSSTNTSNPNSALFVWSNGSGDVISSMANGTGRAGSFSIVNSTNTFSALSATTNGSGNTFVGSNSGTGSAAQFTISNPSNSANALYSFTVGTGIAGNFEIINGANTKPVISAYTTGTGKAIEANNNSTTNATAYLLNSNYTGLALQTSGGLKFGGTNVGTPSAGKVLTAIDANGTATWQTIPISSNLWNIAGNTAINPATDFIGTTDAQPLVIKTNNTEQIRVLSTGNVGIGTSTTTAKLEVAGFTKLGSASAPAIKMLELTETTSSSNSGYSAGVAHGLDATKIISVSVIIETGGLYIPPAYDDNLQLKYNYFYNATTFSIKNQASSCASGTHICSKTAKILITYKQ